jgi:hypothetical protein
MLPSFSFTTPPSHHTFIIFLFEEEFFSNMSQGGSIPEYIKRIDGCIVCIPMLF